MAQFKIGTVTVTNGSDAVTGVGMLWLANISVGDWFIRKGDDVSYQVKAVLTDTSLTLATNYAGVTASGVTYSITTDFTANFNIPLLARGDIDTATVFARAMAEIDRLLGQNAGEWIDFNKTPTFVDADTFTLVGDQTDEHHVDRRIRMQDSVELYGTITSSVFTTLTTIDVRLDTGSITAAISAVAVGVASADGRQSISGSGIKSGTPEINAINEDTAGAGVTVDGVLLKDGDLVLLGGLTVPTEVVAGFNAQSPAVVEIADATAAAGVASNYAALVLSTDQNDIAGLVGAIIAVNRDLGVTEKRIAQIDFLTDGATNSGEIRFFTANAGTLGERMSIDKAGAIVVSSTVDGRDLATDGTKLDGIETAATADQTGAEIATALNGEAVTGLIDLESESIEIKGQKFQSITLAIKNIGGTMNHAIGGPAGSGSAGNFRDKINAATAAFNTTPTGTDSSTAMAFGGKILSGDLNAFVIDVAAQIGVDMLYNQTIKFNNTGTDIVVSGQTKNRNINGVTQVRLEFFFNDTITGASFNLNTTNIANTKFVEVNALLLLA